MQRVFVNYSVGLTDEKDNGEHQALNSKTDFHIPERFLEVVLVSLPDPPPSETEKEVDIKKELPVFLQEVFQQTSPLGVQN